MHPDDKDKTAFITRKRGLLRWTVMPFGLKNATASYCRALGHTLRGLLWIDAVQYCDDVAIMGDSHEDHMDRLLKVLTRFSINGVTMKLSKCEFGVEKIDYVGHVVHAGKGIEQDPNKATCSAVTGLGLSSRSLTLFGSCSMPLPACTTWPT